MEIRNQLTLELITILQPTETITQLTGPLTYSPDGRSIACASDTAIIVWDIQTGGVTEEIECSTNNISLVWSPDGQMLCTVNGEDRVTFTVYTYNVSSGTTLSHATFRSEDKPYLWADDNSFWVMTMTRRGTINIFKVGSALTPIQSFVFPPEYSIADFRAFSPTTHCISISSGGTLRIFNIQTSQSLLDYQTIYPLSGCFSSDGSLFAASQESHVHIWKYSPGKSTPSCYTLLGVFPCQDRPKSLRFSPTPSSILRQSRNILQVSRLHKIPTTPKSYSRQYVGLSRSGAHAVTAHKMERAVTIIDLVGQTPPQYIDTGMEIQGLALTGNVLIVAGFAEVVAWLLTEEGLVGGVIGDRRVGRSDMIWSIPVQEPSGHSCQFSVEGYVGVIWPDEGAQHTYHTETGEVLHPAETRDLRIDWRYFNWSICGWDYLRYHNLSQCDTPPKDSWKTSRDTLREGWVKDPEGQYRLWVPTEWRTDWDPADWRHDVTTQFSLLGGRPVLIKF